ncbi:MAG: HlyD family efflux transporter periplasmic adaptor subunit [Planctomycetota bacterium]
MSTETAKPPVEKTSTPGGPPPLEPQGPIGGLPVLTATEFPSIDLAKKSKLAHRCATILLASFGVTVVGLLFLPWQQNVSGKGRVTAFNPLERQQLLESPVSGRVDRIPEGIVDNAAVKKGQVLVEIGGIDPDLIPNLERQLDAAQRKAEQMELLIATYETKLEAERMSLDFNRALIEQQIGVAERELALKIAKRDEAQAEETRAKQILDRTETLFRRGAESEDKFEEAQRKERTTLAKLNQAIADVEAAEGKVLEKKESLRAKLNEINSKIQSAEALVRDAEGKRADAEAKIADSQSKLNKQQQQVVRAQRDGFIDQVLIVEGQAVKPGDKLISVVPESDTPAVEIWVDGNDVPLVSSIAEDGEGSHVRLMFEGWPAVQFAGWPSVSVGTFGGVVASVAQNDAGSGNFRLVVVPDPTDRPWPSTKTEPGKRNYLRQGARANGWVLLNRVPLGYELWRQLNGFPPSVLPGEDATMKSSGGGPPKDDKAPKPPKVKL